MSETTSVSPRTFTLTFLLIAVVTAAVVSLYSSGRPDGLMYVAGRTGFLVSAKDHATGGGPLADYSVSGIGNPRLSVGLAGLIGCTATFLVALGVSRLAKRS